MAKRFERRVAGRLPLNLPVHVDGAELHEAVFLSHEWSSSGVFLRTQAPYPVGQRLEMFALIGRPTERITLSGVVVRHGRPERGVPLGMAVMLDSLPTKLRTFLEEIAREPVPMELTIESTIAPTVFVVGGDQALRSAAAEVLGADGYEVTEAEHAVAAAGRLDQGLAPRALVVFENDGRTLAGLKDHLPMTNPPDVVVCLGVPPRDLGDGFGVPMVVLPGKWPKGRLPLLLKDFVTSEEVELEIVSEAEAESQSWFHQVYETAPT